jgi:ABC-type Na+ efflux pump permease subunit
VFWGDPAVTLPGLVLLGSLALVSLWPTRAQKEARWRPVVFGGLLLVWGASSLVASGQTPVPVWFSWMWITLPSVALVVVAVSAVREGVAVRSSGLFVVGVLAMVALVVMHFTASSQRFGRSALVLFAAAGVLWWISRAGIKVHRDE